MSNTTEAADKLNGATEVFTTTDEIFKSTDGLVKTLDEAINSAERVINLLEKQNSPKSHFQDILDFHNKFGLEFKPCHHLLEGEALKFRIDFLQEELNELRQAHDEGNLDDAVDALIDLEVVLLGTAQFMGISLEAYEEHWNEVHSANMAKERCKDPSQSKRGTSLDIRKPAGWKPPHHQPIINKYKIGE